MVKLDESDLAVLALLAERPLYSPPPLVQAIAEELRPSGLTYFKENHWYATPLARKVLVERDLLDAD